MPAFNSKVHATSKRSGPPPSLSRQIEAKLRSRVLLGEWPSGAMIPGRKALAQEYGVALNTLQRAISSLVEDGTLEVDSRRGTFVARGRLPMGGDGKAPSKLPRKEDSLQEGEESNASSTKLGIIVPSPREDLEVPSFRAPWATLAVHSLESFCGRTQIQQLLLF